MHKFVILLAVLLIKHDFVSCECPNDSFFDCGNDLCVAQHWLCDGDDDCGNWADELACERHEPANVSCPLKHVRCSGTESLCIPEKWLCDGMPDCVSGTDETNCSQTSEAKNCDYSHGSYRCFGGQCIASAIVCDKRRDCPKGDDEGVECDTDGCHRRNCSHSCERTPRGPQCQCPVGYELGADSLSCVDVDECVVKESDGICSQKCMNTEGSYRCHCFDGYRLVNNNSCVAKEGEPLLLFASSRGIHGLWLAKNLSVSVYPSLTQVVGLDVYGAEERVFFINSRTTNSGIYSVDLKGEDIQSIKKTGLKAPADLAIDWIAQNMYITDSELNRIIVCQLNSSICSSTLFGHINMPRAIVVDPPNGYVYWTECGSRPGIYQAGMDGSNRVTLVDEDIKWPNGLAHDYTTDRLYWTDTKKRSIEYYHLKSKQRNAVLHGSVLHPFAISVFEDTIYWSDWLTNWLGACDKFSGHNQRALIKDIGHNVMSVRVYHPLKQKRVDSPCRAHSCSHLCLLAPNSTFSCACPEYMLLDSDRRNCSQVSNSSENIRSKNSGVFSKTDNHNSGYDWLKLIMISVITTLIVLIFIRLIKTIHNRLLSFDVRVEHIFYSKKDGLKDVMIHNPIYRADDISADEKHLNCDNNCNNLLDDRIIAS